MRFNKVLISINARLKDDDLKRVIPKSVDVIGLAMANIAGDYVRKHKTGYYPAIEFFRIRDDVDQGIISDAYQAAWQVAKHAREIILKCLRPIFSSVQFQSVQTLAFSLPRVRPNQAGAIDLLAAHYTPDTVKIELIVTLMHRDSDTVDDRAESYARKMIYRWLSSEFASVEVTGSKAF